MKHKQSQQTLTTLANGAELVNAIVQGVVGNDIADTINGSPLTRSLVYNLTQTQFQATVAKHLGA